MVVIHPEVCQTKPLLQANGYSDGKEANSRPSSPRSLTTSARRTTVYKKGSQGVAELGELQGGTLNAPSYPTASQTDPKGLYFIVVSFFRWPCYQIQADTPVDVWSNHACQVALFSPGVRTAC